MRVHVISFLKSKTSSELLFNEIVNKLNCQCPYLILSTVYKVDKEYCYIVLRESVRKNCRGCFGALKIALEIRKAPIDYLRSFNLVAEVVLIDMWVSALFF